MKWFLGAKALSGTFTFWFLEMQNSELEELQSTELGCGPQSEHLHQGRTCFFKCEFDFPQFHLKNSIFLLWVNCNNMLSCAKLWVSEEQRCSKVRIMRRKREIYLKIHLSPPLALSISWLPGEVQLIFSPLQWLGTLLQGQKKRGNDKTGWFHRPLSCESIQIHYFIMYTLMFVPENSAFLHLQELYTSVLVQAAQSEKSH